MSGSAGHFRAAREDRDGALPIQGDLRCCSFSEAGWYRALAPLHRKGRLIFIWR